jgi:hypothetical protein
MVRPSGNLACAALIAAAALAASACATEGSAVKGAGAEAAASREKTADLTPFYPLEVGNTWTYRGTLLGQQQTSKVTITGREGPVYMDDRGGRLAFDRDGLRDAKRYLLKGPPVKGTSWVSVTSLTSTERFEIIDNGRKFAVPAGTFEGCLVVRAINKIDAQKSLVTEWTFAPGAGIIRIETFLDRNGKEMLPQGRFELVSYTLKGPKK